MGTQTHYFEIVGWCRSGRRQPEWGHNFDGLSANSSITVMYRYFGDRLTIFAGQFLQKVIIFEKRVIISNRFCRQNIKVEKGADRMRKNIPSCKVRRTNKQSNDLQNFKSLFLIK